jgi:hypothetical protein
LALRWRLAAEPRGATVTEVARGVGARAAKGAVVAALA